MFWRILGQLFSASRGRLAVALLALASGAAVTTALINLNLDAERKVSGEFRTLGANAIILPKTPSATESVAPDAMPTNATVKMNSDVSSAPLMSESVMNRLASSAETNGVISAPFLYVVKNVQAGDTEQALIVAGTWLDRAVQLAPWWKITGEAITDRNDLHHCLVGANVARQLKIFPGSQISLGYANHSREMLASLTV